MHIPLKIVFFGTPDVAVPSLRALLADPSFEVVLVVTQPDRPVGRRRELTPPPVKLVAEEAGIPVLQPEKIGADEVVQLQECAADFFVVVSFGQILSQQMLDIPRIAPINTHFSLLPAWRGAAPVPAAIRAGETQSGLSFFHLVRALDAGGVYYQRRLPLPTDQTTAQVLQTYADVAARELPDVLTGIACSDYIAEPQVGEPTFAPTMIKDDGRLDWSQSAHDIYNHIRAVTPWPGAWTMHDDQRLKILTAHPPQPPLTKGGSSAETSGAQGGSSAGTVFTDDERVFVATGDGVLELQTVQPAGKKEMPAIEWLRGAGQWVCLS